MEKHILKPSFTLLLFLCISMLSFSQTNPGTENLMHQWTFDNGSVNDNVNINPVHGVLNSGAYIADNKLILSQEGQYMSFSGSQLALNTYTVISQEIWFTPTAGANGGFAHIAYFGRTVGSSGDSFLFTMPARADDMSRVAISNGSLSNQVIVNGPEYDDGTLHHFISVVRNDSLFFYIDGKLVDKTVSNVPLSGISTSLAYLGKSGFTADPTWIGSISKFSIYNKSLSSDEVAFLYELGPENNAKIITSPSSLSFPEHGSKKVAVWGVNLSQNISITASTGFTVTPTTIPANTSGDSVTVTYNGNWSTSGTIHFQSGSESKTINIVGSVDPDLQVSKSQILLDDVNNSAQFLVYGYNLSSDIIITSPDGITLSANTLPANTKGEEITVAYNGFLNSNGTITLTSGSAMEEITVFATGNKECFTPLYPGNLIHDPTLNYDATGIGNRAINDNPDYVYCGSRSGMAADNGRLERNLSGILKTNTQYRVKAKVFKNNPLIKPGNMGSVTYTLAMDSAANPQKYQLIKIAMDSACAYYSKYTPFIQDIYVYYNEGIPTAQASHLGSIGFGPNTSYMWVGTAIHEIAHYFGSGTSTTWRSIMSNGVWTGNAGKAMLASIENGTLKGDTQHFWPYGINYKSEITNLGSQQAQHEALINSVKITKAMLVDDCGYATNNPSTGIGISGWDNSSADIYQEIIISKSWEDIDFTFTTGWGLQSNPKIYFTSQMGYIDNWELYEVKPERTFYLDLTSGWNLVSLPLSLIDMSVSSVFPNATVVKNMSAFYRTDQPFVLNALLELEEANGYLVYNTKNETLQLHGVRLLENTSVGEDLNGNWKLIGTPSLDPVLINDALGGHASEIQIIKNFEGFWESGGMNSIQYLEPGKGYFMK